MGVTPVGGNGSLPSNTVWAFPAGVHGIRKRDWQFLPIMIRSNQKETGMPTRNINLTEHFDHFVQRQISSGRYSNASEIVREALRLLEEEEQEREAKVKALRQAAKQGFDEIDQGKGIVLKGKKAIGRFIADIEADVRTKAANNGG
jgi:antitoxin ParD1/3/4